MSQATPVLRQGYGPDRPQAGSFRWLGCGRALRHVWGRLATHPRDRCLDFRPNRLRFGFALWPRLWQICRLRSGTRRQVKRELRRQGH